LVYTIFILEPSLVDMNTREKAIAYISGAIATYSLRKERGELEDSSSMYDFLSKTIPEELDSEAKIELIDEIFLYVSGSLSRE
jgi:hypothetical protein